MQLTSVALIAGSRNKNQLRFVRLFPVSITLPTYAKQPYQHHGQIRCRRCSAGEVGEIRDDDLKGIFREFDLNGDGFIQRDELRSVMQKMGQSPTEEELDAMFNAADQDNDGNIDFKEFLQIAHANPLSLSLKAVFEELDVDGDGYITRSELRTAFQRMGHSLSDQDIKAIYKHVDANNDGKINFQEFCQMMTRRK